MVDAKLKWAAMGLGVMLVALSGSLASAEVMTVGPSKLQITVPEGWTAKAGPDGSITLNHGGSSATLSLQSVSVEDLGGALEQLDKALKAQIGGIQMSPPERGLFGDIPAMTSEGKGQTDGIAIEVGLMVLWPSEGWAVIVQGLVDPASSDKATPGAAALFGSFRRAPGAQPAPVPWADEAGAKNPPKPAAKP